MPTTMPTARPPVRLLSWGETARAFLLIGRSRRLHRRLQAAHRRLERAETDAAGDELLRVARRWVACHEEIAALLGQPLPPQVAQVRAVLRTPT